MLLRFWNFLRIALFRLDWNCSSLQLGKGIQFFTPVRFTGLGSIVIDDGVCFGHEKSQGCFTGSILIDARCPDASIFIGKDCIIGNDCTVIAFSSRISMESNCLVGPGVIIVNSDFHPLNPSMRRQKPGSLPVRIGENVTLGFSSVVLKGVEIGSDCFIGAGAVVTKSVPAMHKIFGNPASSSPL